MVRLALSVLAISAVILFQSCGPEPIPCMRVSSSIISETRDVEDFKGVVSYVSINLIITEGPEYFLKLTGPDNVVELTKTSVVSDYLTISTDDCFNGDYELIVEITAPDYELINVSEACTIKTNNIVKGQNIHFEFFGNVVVNAALEMDSVFTIVAGNGEVDFAGSTFYHQMTLDGVFEIKGFELMSSHTAIDLRGTGDCEVYAQEKLDVFLKGNGNIYYKGSPTLNSDITGIGEIINSN